MKNIDEILRIAEIIQTQGALVASYEGGAELDAEEWAAAEALARGPEVGLSFVDDPAVKWPGTESAEPPRPGGRR